jgi:acyl-CoA synthetase (AMP-forming)/AMP-acid ligase II
VLQDILAKAKTQMVDYKVPEGLAIVESTPRSASGKIERKLALAIFKRNSVGDLANTL